MGNYSATAALLTAFDMQLDTEEPPLLPQQRYAARLFAPDDAPAISYRSKSRVKIGATLGRRWDILTASRQVEDPAGGLVCAIRWPLPPRE
jgi:hypothetical protein